MIATARAFGKNKPWPQSFRDAVDDVGVSLPELARQIGGGTRADTVRLWYCGRSRPRKQKSREALKAFFGWSEVELPPRRISDGDNWRRLPPDYPNERDLQIMELLSFCGASRTGFRGSAEKSQDPDELIARHQRRLETESELHKRLTRVLAEMDHPRGQHLDVLAANLVDQYRGRLEQLDCWVARREEKVCV